MTAFKRSVLVLSLGLAGMGSAIPNLSLALDVVVTAPEEQRTPVEDAIVSIWCSDKDEAAILLDRSRTDENGMVSLSDGCARESVLLVCADDLLRREVDLPAEISSPVEIALERGQSKSLRVRDPDGRPIKEFSYTVLPESRFSTAEMTKLNSVQSVPGLALALLERNSVRTSQSDRPGFELEGYAPRRIVNDQGGVEIRGLSEGPQTLLVGAPGYGVVLTRFSVGGDTPVTVVLDKVECQEALIVDAESGQGVEGAFWAPHPAFTEGRFASLWPAWPSEPDGKLALGCPRKVAGTTADGVVAAPGYAPAILVPGKAVPRIELGRGATITGSAYDANEVPLAGHLAVAMIGGLRRVAEVNANGKYSLSGVPAGKVSLELVNPDGDVVATRQLEVGLSSVREVDFVPGNETRLSILRNGEAWPDVRVLLVLDLPGQISQIRVLGSALSDQSGRVQFLVPEGMDGKMGLVILDENGIVSAPLPKKGLLDRLRNAIVARDESELTIDLEGRYVAGRVVAAEDGEPLASRRVSTTGGAGFCTGIIVDESSPLYIEALAGNVNLCVGRPSATAGTDRRGRFRLFVPASSESDRLTVDGSRLTAEQDAYESASRDLSEVPTDEELLFRLQKAGSIRIDVTDTSGTVPADCYLQWRRTTWGPDTNAGSSECRMDGPSFLEPPSMTPLLIVARAEGLAPAMAGPISIPAGGTDRVRLILRRGGTLRVVGDLPTFQGRAYVPPGTLTDAAGRDWTMIVMPEIDASLGELTFAPLPPGRWTVQLEDRRKRVQLEADQVVTADLRN